MPTRTLFLIFFDSGVRQMFRIAAASETSLSYVLSNILSIEKKRAEDVPSRPTKKPTKKRTRRSTSRTPSGPGSPFDLPPHPPPPLGDLPDYYVFDWFGSEVNEKATFANVPMPGVAILLRRFGYPLDRLPTAGVKEHSLVAVQIRDVLHRASGWDPDKLRAFLASPDAQVRPEDFFRFDAFISYSTKDSNLATELYNDLTGQGLRCFLAEKAVQAGSLWSEEIRGALLQSRTAIVLLTPNSVGSPWLLGEAGAFWVLQKVVIPALLYIAHRDMPEFLSNYQGVDISTVARRRQLVETLKALSTPKPSSGSESEPFMII